MKALLPLATFLLLAGCEREPATRSAATEAGIARSVSDVEAANAAAAGPMPEPEKLPAEIVREKLAADREARAGASAKGGKAEDGG
jgi:hypothetical protein